MAHTAEPSKESPSQLRDLLDHARTSVLVHDVTGRFVDVNRHACETLGYTAEELLAMNVFDVEMDRRLDLEDYWARFEVGATSVLPGAHRRADGHTFPVEVRLSAFMSEGRKLFCAVVEPKERGGGPEAAVPHLVDISVYRGVFDNANEAIAIIDHEGRYLQQNEKHRELLGFTDADLVDKTPAIHLGPVAFQSIAADLIATGRHYGEHVSRTKSGVERRIELSAFSVSQPGDNPPVFVGIKRDIDDSDRRMRERADRERSELEEGLRQAQKMELIGRLAAGVAHDFNNLLTPILGYSDPELIEAELGSGGVTEAIEQIHLSAQRGRDLTRQLLAFGRKQVLEKAPLDLGTVVTRVVNMLRRVIREEIELDLVLPDDVDQVLADANAMEQVLMNLATNAADAMPTGGRMTIEVSNIEIDEGDRLARVLGDRGSFVQLVVSDTGHGMDTQTLDHVFEPFFTQKPPGEGTGLGLSIVYGIVRQHDGFISAESVPGQGSIFRVILPPTNQVATSASEAIDPRPETASATILVAEDEPQVRSLVSHVLTLGGYRVLTASDGLDALEVARKHEGRIDLLLTDVVMPGANGQELYERLSGERPDMRVLFMSGYPRDGLLPSGGSVAEVSIIEKPFSAADLNLRVDRALGL